MKLPVGLIFTDQSLKRLHDLHFVSVSILSSETNIKTQEIFEDNFFPLGEPAGAFPGFVIRKVIDEERYAQLNPQEKLKSHWESFPSDPLQESVSGSLNEAYELQAVHEENEVVEQQLNLFLRIRKTGKIWLLVLRRRASTPQTMHFSEPIQGDYLFEYRGVKCPLWHLGPNCFDLIFVDN